MIATDDSEKTILAFDALQRLPGGGVKRPQPMPADGGQIGNQFIHPFGEDARRMATGRGPASFFLIT